MQVYIEIDITLCLINNYIKHTTEIEFIDKRFILIGTLGEIIVYWKLSVEIEISQNKNHIDIFPSLDTLSLYRVIN